jgi:hypothetical protein
VFVAVILGIGKVLSCLLYDGDHSVSGCYSRIKQQGRAMNGVIMKIRTWVLLVVTHCVVGVVGFGMGIYTLPILIAPPAPSQSEVVALAAQAEYSAEFIKDLKDSDRLHWGEGTVSVSATAVTFMGKLAPGPDYRLYFSPEFVESEADFNRLKPTMVQVGDVKTFDNFVVNLPPDTDLSAFNTVIIWCETFGEFITAAQYR